MLHSEVTILYKNDIKVPDTTNRHKNNKNLSKN